MSVLLIFGHEHQRRIEKLKLLYNNTALIITLFSLLIPNEKSYCPAALLLPVQMCQVSIVHIDSMQSIRIFATRVSSSMFPPETHRPAPPLHSATHSTLPFSFIETGDVCSEKQRTLPARFLLVFQQRLIARSLF